MDNERQTSADAAQSEQPKEVSAKKKFKIDKKMIIAFVAGIVLTAIVFTGVIFGVNPELLKGTVRYDDILITDKDLLESKLETADRPVILLTSVKEGYYNNAVDMFLRAALEFQKDYGNFADIYVYVASDYSELYNNAVNKLFVIESNNILAVKSITYTVTEADIYNFAQDSGVKEWLLHDTTKSDPTVYVMFKEDSRFNARLGISRYYDDNNLGEIKLFAGNNMPQEYDVCDGRTHTGFSWLPIVYYQEPFDQYSFTFPDLRAGVPLAGTAYVMCEKGYYPEEYYDVQVTPVGGIAYYEYKDMPLLNWNHITEIRLMKNVNMDVYGKTFIPCDGRELSLREYEIFNFFLGNGYNGANVTPGYFRVPDLRGKSPIAGAEYYITVEGLVPLVPIAG